MTSNNTFYLNVQIRVAACLLAALIISCRVNASDIGETGLSSMFSFTHLSAADGLSNQRVFSVVQGSDRAIWIATKNDVERFNGIALQKYPLDFGDKFNLASGRMIRLYKSRDGTLYAFTNAGQIFSYDIVSDSFKKLYDLPRMLNSNLILNAMAVTAEGMWAATDKGLWLLQKDGSWKTIVGNVFFNSITEAPGALYAGSFSGVFCVCKGRPRLLFPHVYALSSYYDSRGGRLWIGTFSDGLAVGDVRTGVVKPIARHLPKLPVRVVTPLNSTTMTVGIDGGGVYGVSAANGSQRFLFSTGDEGGGVLHGNGIYDICVDMWGDLWIGSYSGGVDIATASDGSLKLVQHEAHIPQSLANDNVNDVCDDGNGNIYFATDRGLSIYNPGSRSWKHALPGNVVLSIGRGLDGRMLAGTYGKGVKDINGKVVYARAEGTLRTDYVYTLYNDGRGSLWVGCLDGDLVEITAKGNHYYPIQNVQSITDTPGDGVAIATADGFFVIDHRRQVHHYFSPGEFQSRDVNTYVMAMLFASSSEVWLGTDGGGVYVYNMKVHSMRQLTVKDGLPSNSVKSLTRDRKGRIWIATDHGLAYIMPGRRSGIKKPDWQQGNSLEFNRAAATILSDGRLIFGSTGGAAVVDPDKVSSAGYKGRLVLRDIIVAGMDDSTRSTMRPRLNGMIRKGKVVLPYADNSLTLLFECINLRYQSDIGYQYYIEGQQDKVQPAGDGRIVFNNLASGTYRIHFQAVSRGDGRVIDERVVELRIRQPWWNSWWAWLIYFCIAGVAVWFLWRFYLNRLQRRHDAERIDFFVNTAHDIRTPLSLTLAPLDDIAADKTLSPDSRNYLDIARRNGRQLMTLITTLLDFQKVDSRQMQLHVRQLDLKTLLEKACARFHVLSQQKHITLVVTDCPDNVSVWMDENAADKIFNNLLSNAVKYTGENGRVEVSAHTDAGHVYIDISDNGIGIPDKAQRKIFSSFYRAGNALRSHAIGSGLGLMLVKRIVEAHHGTINFKSKEGIGTTFTIVLLKGYEHLKELIESDTQEAPPIPMVAATDNDDATRPVMLFVDDNAELRGYMQTAFGKDFNVVACDSAHAALDYLASGTCDVMVSDVMMPGMHGDELCRRIKADEATSFIPVVLLTANAGRDMTIDGLECGADDYVTKPFDTAVLRARIASILHNRQVVRDYYLRRAAVVAHEDAGGAKNTASEEKAEVPSGVTLSDADKQFVDRATSIVMENMHDEDFDINSLCREMAMSRTLFYNRLKALTGQTPQDFIRILRLERAARLLEDDASVLNASIETGFANVKYFSTVFKKHFGISPSKYHSK